MDSSIIVVIFIAAAVGLYFWTVFRGTQASTTNNVTIQGTIEDGRKLTTSGVALPVSVNQKEGLTFSYTCWVLVDDFTYRYGEKKVVFVKGPEDLSSACPALLVDANTNAFLVELDTYGSRETIAIGNIPAKKWLHVAIAVDQDSVDIYINGIVHTHHTLTQLPRQNNDTVHTGIGGGFNGKIAGLQYYAYFMKPQDVLSSMKSTPTPGPGDATPAMPPYFDLTWWTKST
jgi:hypothetical protein